jgi:hypothetical protein
MSAHNRRMATQAKLTIRVRAARGSSNLRCSTTGRYISLTVNGIDFELPQQPIMPTNSPKDFWLAVLPFITAHITSLP